MEGGTLELVELAEVEVFDTDIQCNILTFVKCPNPPAYVYHCVLCGAGHWFCCQAHYSDWLYYTKGWADTKTLECLICKQKLTLEEALAGMLPC